MDDETEGGKTIKHRNRKRIKIKRRTFLLYETLCHIHARRSLRRVNPPKRYRRQKRVVASQDMFHTPVPVDVL